MVALVAGVAERGLPVRALGSAHSFSPVVATDGLLLDMSAMHEIRSIDADRLRVVVEPGITVGELGGPLWDAGLSLANQGDIDAQQMAGAVATGTHGSGITLGSFSAAVTRMRLATPRGVVEVDAGDPELLAAAQVAIGLLGVITELELEVVPAHRLRERIERWSWDQAWKRFDELAREHRHYSFFWIPTEASAELYGLAGDDGGSLADVCFVKIYDLADDSEPDSGEEGRRVDRGYRIYPMQFEPNFDELEYFVPYERGVEAGAALRELMLTSLPASVFPLEVRTVRRDSSYLSHSYERDSMVFSVSGVPGTEYEPYLRAVDRLLGEFDARVHWGKLHYLTRDQLHARYPKAGEFIATRRRLDPEGVFLNDHLRTLFA